MKRIFDFIISLAVLMMLSPVLVVILIAVWLQDFCNPFYIAPRVGKSEKIFKMIKIRSMIIGADKTGVDSTSNNDNRITKLGQFIRAFKVDELGQLFNVLVGDMSLVGPRPNVERETRLYTAVEKNLLTVRPGITDFASIVYSDEGEILSAYSDPDIAYNQLIRPGKSELGLFYIEKKNLVLDIKICILTILNFINREGALQKIKSLLEKEGASPNLVKVAGRRGRLTPSVPPGGDKIITTRNL